jgi:hypothetical protein
MKNIIGNSIKMATLEIAEHDFPEAMRWNDSKKACAALGNGWRLPTMEELDELYNQKDQIGGLFASHYCSSTEVDSMVFLSRWIGGKQFGIGKGFKIAVRAVRTFGKKKYLIKHTIKNIIGNPIKIGSPIMIGNLEIAEHDFPEQMNWNEAKSACAALGDGWRLPTKGELNELFSQKDEIVSFADGYYWSSSEVDNYKAWNQYFANGYQKYPIGKYEAGYVRAVRGILKFNYLIKQTIKNIIGNPIKIDNLEIAEHDFPTQMTWSEAKSVFDGLGDGWRLPTKEELKIMYNNENKIGGFAYSFYWSCCEYNSANGWSLYLLNGSECSRPKNYSYCVRAVRFF